MRQGPYLFSSMIKQNLLSSLWTGQVASGLDGTGCVWIEGKSPFPCQGAWGVSSRPPAEATLLGHELLMMALRSNPSGRTLLRKTPFHQRPGFCVSSSSFVADFKEKELARCLWQFRAQAERGMRPAAEVALCSAAFAARSIFSEQTLV